MFFTGTKAKDLITLTTDDDFVFGGRGNDGIADALFDDISNDIMFGGLGNDSLLSWGGKDALFGGRGADSFIVHSFFEGTIISGGRGFDTLYLAWMEGEHDLSKLDITGIEKFVFVDDIA